MSSLGPITAKCIYYREILRQYYSILPMKSGVFYRELRMLNACAFSHKCSILMRFR